MSDYDSDLYELANLEKTTDQNEAAAEPVGQVGPAAPVAVTRQPTIQPGSQPTTVASTTQANRNNSKEQQQQNSNSNQNQTFFSDLSILLEKGDLLPIQINITQTKVYPPQQETDPNDHVDIKNPLNLDREQLFLTKMLDPITIAQKKKQQEGSGNKVQSVNTVDIQETGDPYSNDTNLDREDRMAQKILEECEDVLVDDSEYDSDGGGSSGSSSNSSSASSSASATGNYDEFQSQLDDNDNDHQNFTITKDLYDILNQTPKPLLKYPEVIALRMLRKHLVITPQEVVESVKKTREEQEILFQELLPELMKQMKQQNNELGLGLDLESQHSKDIMNEYQAKALQFVRSLRMFPSFQAKVSGPSPSPESIYMRKTGSCRFLNMLVLSQTKMQQGSMSQSQQSSNQGGSVSGQQQSESSDANNFKKSSADIISIAELKYSISRWILPKKLKILRDYLTEDARKQYPKKAIWERFGDNGDGDGDEGGDKQGAINSDGSQSPENRGGGGQGQSGDKKNQKKKVKKDKKEKSKKEKSPQQAKSGDNKEKQGTNIGSATATVAKTVTVVSANPVQKTNTQQPGGILRQNDNINDNDSKSQYQQQSKSAHFSSFISNDLDSEVQTIPDDDPEEDKVDKTNLNNEFADLFKVVKKQESIENFNLGLDNDNITNIMQNKDDKRDREKQNMRHHQIKGQRFNQSMNQQGNMVGSIKWSLTASKLQLSHTRSYYERQFNKKKAPGLNDNDQQDQYDVFKELWQEYNHYDDEFIEQGRNIGTQEPQISKWDEDPESNYLLDPQRFRIGPGIRNIERQLLDYPSWTGTVKTIQSQTDTGTHVDNLNGESESDLLDLDDSPRSYYNQYIQSNSISFGDPLGLIGVQTMETRTGLDGIMEQLEEQGGQDYENEDSELYQDKDLNKGEIGDTGIDGFQSPIKYGKNNKKTGKLKFSTNSNSSTSNPLNLTYQPSRPYLDPTLFIPPQYLILTCTNDNTEEILNNDIEICWRDKNIHRGQKLELRLGFREVELEQMAIGELQQRQQNKNYKVQNTSSNSIDANVGLDPTLEPTSIIRGTNNLFPKMSYNVFDEMKICCQGKVDYSCQRQTDFLDQEKIREMIRQNDIPKSMFGIYGNKDLTNVRLRSSYYWLQPDVDHLRYLLSKIPKYSWTLNSMLNHVFIKDSNTNQITTQESDQDLNLDQNRLLVWSAVNGQRDILLNLLERRNVYLGAEHALFESIKRDQRGSVVLLLSYNDPKIVEQERIQKKKFANIGNSNGVGVTVSTSGKKSKKLNTNIDSQQQLQLHPPSLNPIRSMLLELNRHYYEQQLQQSLPKETNSISDFHNLHQQVPDFNNLINLIENRQITGRAVHYCCYLGRVEILEFLLDYLVTEHGTWQDEEKWRVYFAEQDRRQWCIDRGLSVEQPFGSDENNVGNKGIDEGSKHTNSNTSKGNLKGSNSIGLNVNFKSPLKSSLSSSNITDTSSNLKKQFIRSGTTPGQIDGAVGKRGLAVGKTQTDAKQYEKRLNARDEYLKENNDQSKQSEPIIKPKSKSKSGRNQKQKRSEANSSESDHSSNSESDSSNHGGKKRGKSSKKKKQNHNHNTQSEEEDNGFYASQYRLNTIDKQYLVNDINDSYTSPKKTKEFFQQIDNQCNSQSALIATHYEKPGYFYDWPIHQKNLKSESEQQLQVQKKGSKDLDVSKPLPPAPPLQRPKKKEGPLSIYLNKSTTNQNNQIDNNDDLTLRPLLPHFPQSLCPIPNDLINYSCPDTAWQCPLITAIRKCQLKVFKLLLFKYGPREPMRDRQWPGTVPPTKEVVLQREGSQLQHHGNNYIGNSNQLHPLIPSSQLLTGPSTGTSTSQYNNNYNPYQWQHQLYYTTYDQELIRVNKEHEAREKKRLEDEAQEREEEEKKRQEEVRREMERLRQEEEEGNIGQQGEGEGGGVSKVTDGGKVKEIESKGITTIGQNQSGIGIKDKDKNANGNQSNSDNGSDENLEEESSSDSKDSNEAGSNSDSESNSEESDDSEETESESDSSDRKNNTKKKNKHGSKTQSQKHGTDQAEEDPTTVKPQMTELFSASLSKFQKCPIAPPCRLDLNHRDTKGRTPLIWGVIRVTQLGQKKRRVQKRIQQMLAGNKILRISETNRQKLAVFAKPPCSENLFQDNRGRQLLIDSDFDGDTDLSDSDMMMNSANNNLNLMEQLTQNASKNVERDKARTIKRQETFTKIKNLKNFPLTQKSTYNLQDLEQYELLQLETLLLETNSRLAILREMIRLLLKTYQVMKSGRCREFRGVVPQLLDACGRTAIGLAKRSRDIKLFRLFEGVND